MTEHDIVLESIPKTADKPIMAGFNKGGFQKFLDPNNSRDKETKDTVFDSSPTGFNTSAWKSDDR